MRLTKYHLPTLKEAPADAEVVSHKLMIRAGLIRKLAAGIYTLLPLGLRVIRKVENIIREEMNREGGIEVSMPSMIPSELWRESGRWDKYGKELLRITDRHGREFCYGPTHEEVVTDLVRRDVRSYRDLPLNLYQIQNKFRDEIRPRFGVMRGREFTMKDAYSFDVDDEAAELSYVAMRRAYIAIFNRAGITSRAVEADTGQIGGSSSHEFMVMAESGEDLIAFCDTCDYAANVEKVELRASLEETMNGLPASLEKVATPAMKSIDEVSTFLKVAPRHCIKTLIYKTDSDECIAALCRGDHEINETRLARAIGASEMRLATDDEIRDEAGTIAGFAGPVGLSIKVVADESVASMINGVTGANEPDTHYTGVNSGRDFTPTLYAGIRQAVSGDGCPRCDTGALQMARGIEVGHIFKLGTKYSVDMGATYLDANGKDQPMVMGCYGIGVGRTAAAAIEQNHDENGIIWPPAIAPFEVVVLPLVMKDDGVVTAADGIYAELLDIGIDAALDDRDLRAGVKFADADLIGYPLQVVVGKKSLAMGNAELKIRSSGERENVPLGEIVGRVQKILASLMSL